MQLLSVCLDGMEGWGADGTGRGTRAGQGVRGTRLEVGGGADAEAGGLLVEEAGRGQVLGGQAE
jgi:hypothetical protein